MVTRRAGFPALVREAPLVAPPERLSVTPGDTIRVTSEFDYLGPAVSGKLYSALWHPSLIDPHDEIAHGVKDFSIPDSPTLRHWSGYVDIVIPDGFAGTDFGLYTKLAAVPGPDIFSPYYDNVIEIVAAIPEFTSLEITSYVKR